jgi:hypothetical protein
LPNKARYLWPKEFSQFQSRGGIVKAAVEMLLVKQGSELSEIGTPSIPLTFFGWTAFLTDKHGSALSDSDSWVVEQQVLEQARDLWMGAKC